MESNLILELQHLVNTLPSSDTNYMIASYLLDHLFEIESITINDIADSCFTSCATVSRFVRNIGYDNFQAMKSTNGTNKYRTSKELFMNNREGLKFNTNNDQEELKSYVRDVTSALFNLADEIDFKAVDTLLAKIHNTDLVYICGTQLPGLLAEHLQFMLLNSHKRTYVARTRDQQYRMLEELRNFNGSKMVIILSANGNYCNVYKDIIFELIELGVYKAIVTHDPNLKWLPDFENVLLMADATNSKVGRYKLQLMIEIMVNRYYNLYVEELFGSK